MSNCVGVFVLNEKHGVRVVNATDREKASAHILVDRINEGYWYDEFETRNILNAITNGRAYLALKARSRYEYEGFEEMKIEDPFVGVEDYQSVVKELIKRG